MICFHRQNMPSSPFVVSFLFILPHIPPPHRDLNYPYCEINFDHIHTAFICSQVHPPFFILMLKSLLGNKFRKVKKKKEFRTQKRGIYRISTPFEMALNSLTPNHACLMIISFRDFVLISLHSLYSIDYKFFFFFFWQ